MSTTIAKVNPRALPQPSDLETRRANKRVAFHEGSPDWLPVGLFS